MTRTQLEKGEDPTYMAGAAKQSLISRGGSNKSEMSYESFIIICNIIFMISYFFSAAIACGSCSLSAWVVPRYCQAYNLSLINTTMCLDCFI